MQEVGAGRLALDAPVAALIPELSGRPGAAHDRHATRSPSASCSPRLRAAGPPPVLEQAAHVAGRALAIVRLAAREPLAYLPGTRAVYSDLGFILLGWLLERLTGAAPRRRSSRSGSPRPLGLPSTTFVSLADSEARARLLGDRSVAATQVCPERHGARPGRGRRPERLRHGRHRRSRRPVQRRGRAGGDRGRAVARPGGARPARTSASSRATHPRVLVAGGRPRVDLAARLGRPGARRARRRASACRATPSGTWRSPAARSGSIRRARSSSCCSPTGSTPVRPRPTIAFAGSAPPARRRARRPRVMMDAE